jgi:hypothetical protein
MKEKMSKYTLREKENTSKKGEKSLVDTIKKTRTLWRPK